jgi:hypothetical protein
MIGLMSLQEQQSFLSVSSVTMTRQADQITWGCSALIQLLFLRISSSASANVAP